MRRSTTACEDTGMEQRTKMRDTNSGNRQGADDEGGEEEEKREDEGKDDAAAAADGDGSWKNTQFETSETLGLSTQTCTFAANSGGIADLFS